MFVTVICITRESVNSWKLGYLHFRETMGKVLIVEFIILYLYDGLNCKKTVR